MTYMNPGRKDHVYTEKINGEKVYEQKKYLLWSLRDACEAINGLGFENKFGKLLSFSKFYRFINSKMQNANCKLHWSLWKCVPHGSGSDKSEAWASNASPWHCRKVYMWKKLYPVYYKRMHAMYIWKKSLNHGVLIRMLIWILNPLKTALMIILLSQRGQGKKEK